MCRLLPIGLVLLATTGVAVAKPKLAITPIDGDKGGKVGAAIAEAVSDEVTIIPRDRVADKMDRLGMSGELVPFDREKLQGRLDATALVEGKVTSGDGRSTLRLTITTNEKTSRVMIRYTNPRSAAFRKNVRAAIGKRLGIAGEQSPAAEPEPEPEDESETAADTASEKPRKRKRATIVDDDEDDTEKAKPKDKPQKKAKKPTLADADEDEDREERPKKKAKKPALTDADEDEDAEQKPKKKSKKRVATEDEDEAEGDDGAIREDQPRKRRASALAAARVDGGASYGARQLSYLGRGDMLPPRVGTGAASGRIAGELYPFGFSEPNSKVAGVGLVGEFDKTVGLAIAVPGTGEQAPIDQLHYSVGAQYRLAFGRGGAALAFGLRYAVRKYAADRSGLANKADLDMPDVKYKATAPTLAARVPITSSIAAFAGGDFLLITTTGPIQKPENFGAAKVFGFDAAAGADIALSSKFALRFAGELSQINFKFVGGDGTMAEARGVKGAIDRSFGVVGTLAVTY